MPAGTANLFLLEDLEDSERIASLRNSDLVALHSVADWIRDFVAQPHSEVGRQGAICPFVPGARERQTVWLAPERTGELTLSALVEMVNTYRKLLLQVQPVQGECAAYKAIVLVLTDLSADRATRYMTDMQLQQLKRQAYVEDGVVIGDFHPANAVSSIRNAHFYPFRSPVPFLLFRLGVVDDWRFFLDNDDWFALWARRFGEGAVQALGEQLRRTNWRQLDAAPPAPNGIDVAPSQTRD